MNLRNILLGFVLLFSTNILFAQTSAGDDEFTEKGALPILNSQSLTIFAGEEGDTYYIDFETISLNLQELVVTRENGEIVMRDDISGLPVNSIYELDLSSFGKGKFQVELRAFTGIMRKELQVR